MNRASRFCAMALVLSVVVFSMPVLLRGEEPPPDPAKVTAVLGGDAAGWKIAPNPVFTGGHTQTVQALYDGGLQVRSSLDTRLQNYAVNALRMFQDALRFIEAEIVGMVYGSAWKAGEVRKNKALMEEAYELGKKIVSG